MNVIEKPLWEILVPYRMGDHRDTTLPKRNRNVPLPYHHEWDEFVRGISGGLTIFKTSRGQWHDDNGRLYKEPMIPVRIACSREDIDKIAAFTLKHYKQKAVFVTLLSETTIIYSENETDDQGPYGYIGHYGYLDKREGDRGIGTITTDTDPETLDYLLKDTSATFYPITEREYNHISDHFDIGIELDNMLIDKILERTPVTIKTEKRIV